MSKMKDRFMEKFGMDLSPKDVAERVYQHGWNDALEEAARQVEHMPFGADTRASFAVFFRQLKEVVVEGM
jgi:hypothetical protein